MYRKKLQQSYILYAKSNKSCSYCNSDEVEYKYEIFSKVNIFSSVA